MKKSSILLEFIIVIVLISIVYSLFLPKPNKNKLKELENRIVLYMKILRYQALIDSKDNPKETLWFKKRWTIKFFRCDKTKGGVYFVIYSDKNMTGHPNQDESLKDPLTNKYIYSTNTCEENTNNSKYTLLSKNFDIKDINISCNNTDSLGQISFGNDGKVYSKLSSTAGEYYEYEIKKDCFIKFTSNDEKNFVIKIVSNTGFID